MYPNDAVSLRRCGDIVEGYFSLSPEYRDLVIKVITKTANMPDIWEDIKRKYQDDHEKIKAIKAVREASKNPLTGEAIMGLKEAKDLVESWDR